MKTGERSSRAVPRKRQQGRARTQRRRSKNYGRRCAGGTNTPSPTKDLPYGAFDPADFDAFELGALDTRTFDDFPIRHRWYDRMPSPVPVSKPPESSSTGQKAVRGTKRHRGRLSERTKKTRRKRKRKAVEKERDSPATAPRSLLQSSRAQTNLASRGK